MTLKKIGLLVASIVVVLSVAAPASSFALFGGAKSAACQGLSMNGTTTDECATGTSTVNGVLRVIVNVFSAIVGIIAVIMIIVAGLKFITASGDSSAVASARSTLLYAIIGLVVAVLAQVIAHFVIARGSSTATSTSFVPSSLVDMPPVSSSYIIT